VIEKTPGGHGVAQEPVFAHGIASGDPTTGSVILWARITHAGTTAVDVDWTIAREPSLRSAVATGTAQATPDRDWTVHVDAGGLDPATTYWYGFRALGEISPVGRTRTLPSGRADHLRIAMVSCAKFNAGFFNAYSRIAAREDLDFVLHLGDYIYEAAQTPPASQTPGADIGRPFQPLNECVTLQDYRTRYAQYRRDPDTQALHAVHPLIATLDDHEFADGAWRDGSLEHRPERDGPWADRRAAAFRARWEWLPARRPDPSDPERVFRSVAFGGLVDLFLIDTRSRRDAPVDGPEMHDLGRTQLGHEQREWLINGLDVSTTRWRLIANSSVLGHMWHDTLAGEAQRPLAVVKLIGPDGRGPDIDQWDGYPAERLAILGHLRDRPVRDVVVLSGDVHVSLALELSPVPFDPDGQVVAVEFVTPSLTSQNVDDKMHWAPRTNSLPIERDLMAALPHLRFVDLDSHGYVVVDVTPERVNGEWWMLDTVLARSDRERLGAAWTVAHGRPGLVPTA
jgi:alkaline phosphatase D